MGLSLANPAVLPAVAPEVLLLFTRYPLAGRTKTRLIPALGAAGAADLQRQMTEHLVTRFRRFCAERQLSLEVHFAGGSCAQMVDWLGPELAMVPQHEGELGERLRLALSRAFADGRQRVVIIGSDCPALGEREVGQAMRLLETHDVAIGPAVDGGYYLIGLSGLHECLFENVPWGTDRVLAVTRAIALQNNLSMALLDPLADIDRPEDLHLWEAQKSVESPIFDHKISSDETPAAVPK